MKIDYSVPESSVNSLYLDVSFRLGYRHIALSLNDATLSCAERIAHFVVGLLMMIPGLGMIAAAIDYALHRQMLIIRLQNTDPYQRGLEQGKLLKSDIHLLYDRVLEAIGNYIASGVAGNREEYNRALERLQGNLSPAILAEMQGLAEGAEREMADVFAIHAFIDIYTSIEGCSAVASFGEEGANERMRVVAGNAFLEEGPPLQRRALLSQAGLDRSWESHRDALRLVSYEGAPHKPTIHSVVFDNTGGEVHLSAAAGHAPFNIFTKMRLNNESGNADQRSVLSAFNLDWPWAFLAPYVKLIETPASEGRRRFVNVTFPGYLGVLRGMNDQGVSIGCCRAGNSRQAGGALLTLLFRQILEGADSVEAAEGILAESAPASSMNLVIADRAQARGYELDPVRAPRGFARRF